MAKDWTKSRTILVNGALNLVSLVSLLASLLAGPDMAALGIAPDVARGAAIAGLIAATLNLWLRTLTSQPLAGTAAARESEDR